jgi:menaquinone-dependent protoporphyrinogen oxidase
MAKILIVYGTVEGQTRKIAGFVNDHLCRRRNDVRLVDAAEAGRDVDPADYDAVIVAASVHMGRHQAAAAHFVKAHLAALQSRPAAFISVSLHALSDDPEDRAETQRYVDVFCRETGWTPRAVCTAAGALRFTQYDFFKALAARRVAKERGVAPDAEGDYEFTDWVALQRFVDEFVTEHVPDA